MSARRVAVWNAGARLVAQIDESPWNTWDGLSALRAGFAGDDQPAIVANAIARLGRTVVGKNDPVLVLVTARFRIWEECNRHRRENGQEVLSEAAFNALASQTGVFSDALDERIARAVATTPEGVIAQIRLLAERDEQPIDDGLVKLMVASIAAGIRKLTGVQPRSICAGIEAITEGQHGTERDPPAA